jgi:DNA-binding LacI/PurR family transcriptional regulator
MTEKTIRTIEDIARLAQVSKSTVSRSLNDSPLVKQETKARIQAIALEHNFRINAPARNLSLRQSHTIAFVSQACHKGCNSEVDLFSLEIMSGITHGLYSLGYELLVVHVDPYESDWAHQYLDSGRVDGFILMTSTRKQWHIKKLLEINAPFIAWGMPQPEINHCSVAGDNLAGGRLAAEHLLGAGRRRIAFLGGPKYELEVQQRFKGFQEVLQSAGLEISPDLMAYGDYSHLSGIRAMDQLLDQSPDLDAVFVNSDLMAVGALTALKNRGRQVPGEVAVVGYDDLSIARYNALPLTTIRQNIHLAGRLLAENLVQYIQTGVVTHITIPVELVVRKSA